MDRTSLPVFTWSPRPPCVPPELLALRPDEDVIVSSGGGGTGQLLAGDFIDEIRQTIARQSEGFYTIMEASHIFAALVPGLTRIAWQEKMKDAWRIGELVIRDTTRTKKSVKAADVSYMDLVKESDLDAWLVKDGGGCRFPKVGRCATTAGDGPATPAAPAQSPAMPAPVVTDQTEAVERSQVKRRTWRDVAWHYVVKTFKAGQYSTAKDYYRALENKAGANDSPFDKGTGVHLHSLFVREISETVTLKTIQNAWADIKASR